MMKKRLIPVLPVLMLLLIVAVFSIQAAEVDYVSQGIRVAEAAEKLVFPTDKTAGTAVCPVCEASVTWQPLTAAKVSGGITLEASGHYYLAEDIETDKACLSAPSTKTVCLHLNGKKLVSKTDNALYGSASVMSVMGEGQVLGGRTTAENGATIQINTAGANGTVNLYGGTYGKYDPATANPVVMIRANGGQISLFSGAKIIGGTGGETVYLKGNLNYTSARFHLYGGTVDGSASTKASTVYMEAPEDLVSSHGTVGTPVEEVFNMYAGTVKNGTATDGGNVFVGANAVFNFFGGTIENGTATNYGGNVHVAGIMNMSGGSIIDHHALEDVDTKGGGGIYVAKDANLNMSGGSISGCAATYGGNLYAAGMAHLENATLSGGIAKSHGGNVSCQGGNVYIGGNTRLENGVATGMGGNIRIWGGTVTMVDGSISGGTCTDGSVRRNMWLQGDGTTKSAFYFLGGTIDAADGADGSGISCGQSGTLYLGGAAEVTGACAGIKFDHAQAKLYVCDGWSGSADIKFTSNYAVGSTLPVTTAEVITLGNDMVTRTPGGDFTGLLLQRNTTVAGLCPTADGTLTVAGAVLVGVNGERKATTDPLADWLAGEYAYIQLRGEGANFADLGGKDVWVDLNGFDLTAGGTGSLYVFDSQNDTYDASRCGVVTTGETVTVAKQVSAPNGKNYVALPNGNGMTFHRLESRITDVVLRPARASLYYRAIYQCDTALAAVVKSYGVALSLADMPGADFLQTEDTEYTVAQAPFQSGVVTTSGEVVNILDASKTAAENRKNGQTPIYANPYICIDAGEERMVVGDLNNADKSIQDAGFCGSAYSLADVVSLLDGLYYTYSAQIRQQIDDFYDRWKDRGADWRSYVNLGNNIVRVDNGALQFDAGTTNALCPVCNKKVAWIAVEDGKTNTLKNGDHYYLTGDMVYTGSSEPFIRGPEDPNTKGCLHLNGHNITATRYRVFTGSGGVLNIMGNGQVSGYSSTDNSGSAVYINNGWPNATVNLYGGTYVRGNAAENAPVLSVLNNGSTMNIYEGATIIDEIFPIYMGYAKIHHSNLRLLGGRIEGGGVIRAVGADPQYGNTATLELGGGVIDARVEVAENTKLILSGAPEVKELVPAAGVRADISSLMMGAKIGVIADGIFTRETDSAFTRVSAFTAVQEGKEILLRGKLLACGKNYTDELEFTGAQKAYCPACEQTVSWKAFDGTAAVKLNSGGHYYLSKDVNWTETSAPVAAPTDGTACFHLNGHDLTATAATAIAGHTGILNVMGQGVVKGCATKSGYGAAVQVSVAAANGTVNLYSGTYDQADTTSTAAYTLSLLYNGGKLHVFDDAVVLSSVSKRAIYTGVAYAADQHLGIRGTEITGTVYLDGADETRGFVSSVTVSDGSISGKFSITGMNTVTFTGAPKLSQLDIAYPNKVNLEKLTDGADITVNAQGRFTEENEKVSSWKQYFKSNNRRGSIQVENNRLACNVDYVSALQFEGGNTAFCPACNKDVVWKAVTEEKISLQNGDHYYFNKDIHDQVSGSSFIVAPTTQNHKACVHLNGFDLTSEATAFYGSGGVLNVMGTGNVTGNTENAGVGAAVQINNGWPNATVNLYGGNYKIGSDSKAEAVAVAVWNNGGTINVYRGATLAGGAYLGAASNTNDGKLALYGATVTGNVTLVGADQTKGNTTTFWMEDGKITGTLDAKLHNSVTLTGQPAVGKLAVQEGLIISLQELLSGTKISVSAEGTFTDKLSDEGWLDYFTAFDTGDWVVIRDHALSQSALLNTTASTEDISRLENLYAGREAFHGNLHEHTASGDPENDPWKTADGKVRIELWPQVLADLDLDFAAIVDHRQSRHMRLDCWDETMFIGATETGIHRIGVGDKYYTIDYNILMTDVDKFEEVLKTFPFSFTDGYFRSPYELSIEQLDQLRQMVRAAGGTLVHVHPCMDGYLVSDDPMDYYLGEYTGIEVLNSLGNVNMSAPLNQNAYKLWLELLNMGKHVYAFAGADSHYRCNTISTSTVYAQERINTSYLSHVVNGDFTAGPVGIRMSIGDTTMGGQTNFAGKRLVICVDDFHSMEFKANHTYRIDVFDEKGLVCTKEFTGEEPVYLAIDAQDCMYYRANVYDVTGEYIFAVGNPIWNTRQ